MDFFQAIVLGIVQGLTEFLPVSSTAHLIIVPAVLGWQFDPSSIFVFDVLVQWGTLLAVLIYFWRDLFNIIRAVIMGLIQRKPFATTDARLGWLIVVATIPAVVVGLLFKDFFAALHEQPITITIILILFSALTFGVERIANKQRTLDSLTWKDALIIGGAQAVALIPGVSRSGATICGALFTGLERKAAARFSFIVAIPALSGAGILAVKDLLELPNFTQYIPTISVGALVAALVGFACIHWLLGFIAKSKMDVFGWYRLIAGAAALAWLLAR